MHKLNIFIQRNDKHYTLSLVYNDLDTLHESMSYLNIARTSELSHWVDISDSKSRYIFDAAEIVAMVADWPEAYQNYQDD